MALLNNDTPGVILYVYDLNSGGTLNKSGYSRAKLHEISEDGGDGSVQESTNSEEQFESSLQLGRRAPYSYKNSMTPSSNFNIRSRYLSRVGTKVLARKITTIINLLWVVYVRLQIDCNIRMSYYFCIFIRSSQ